MTHNGPEEGEREEDSLWQQRLKLTRRPPGSWVPHKAEEAEEVR